MRIKLDYWLSRGLFLAGRSLLRAALNLKLRRQASTPPTWHGYGELLSQRPLFFHYVMFQGPRWNCHALIGVLPAFKVKHSIQIDVAAARRSTAAWTLVIYAREAGPRTCIAIGPDWHTDAAGWARVELTAGEYHIGARYYGSQADAVWPSLRIDDSWNIPARRIDREAQLYPHYLAHIQGQRPWFYCAVHHHVFAALQHATMTPQALDQLVLPVGNPETEFRYGLLPRGACLRLNQEPSLQSNGWLFLTVLNRASLPMYWGQIQDSTFESPRFTETTLYLIRIQPLAGKHFPSDALSIEIDASI